MKKVIFSLKPAWAEKILSGEKKVEFRRSVCTESVDRILLYETSPVRKVTGEVCVDVIISGTPEEVWEKLGDKAAMTKREYDRYYRKKNRAVAYCLSHPVRYERERDLEEYGIASAPRSFVYVECGDGE